ncbi:LysR family transcriptional regulator [Cupriavidus plantarum]|uniref:LysR family transcriptional regulator n=1 Tax=Cupriavidus plantarum TaxID=942865 RepID=A0A316FCD5_9BURK|nr:LysR family transcriptional regulator [Cupriavidus plantarum]NYI00627.1 DNA-binding transcriptional LysR family regulator [Cupriavidus plantarum]PWK35040.1 LysR family transcriptional regulator [Cupriavidus plantarum]REE93481.1 LysR family transcriptional regulator [Cupriavidus plantarum]RLK38910.1 LysR family transcriptional regulator [Cupriavidus plantarum]CAG2136550.1 HTH-type transcriptional regulator ArgP [Cupriavidus plantarum]
MRFSLEQVQVFVVVVETGSFSAAARRLGKTQSTISSAISNLEIDLGVTLFDRTNKIPTVTEAGRTLLGEATAVLERCRSLEAHAASLAGANPAELTLAIEIPYNTVMPVLMDFEREFPYVDLTIRNPMSGDVSELVLKGDAEVGIAFAQPGYSPELDFVQLGKLIMVHVTHPAHPLAALERVSFEDLHAYRRLAFTAHANKLPTTEYLRAARTWQAESYLALMEMVSNGLGWATLPRQLIRDELARGDLVELQLAAYPHTDWLVGVDLVWRRAASRGRAHRWLHHRLQRHMVFEVGAGGQRTTR